MTLGACASDDDDIGSFGDINDVLNSVDSDTDGDGVADGDGGTDGEGSADGEGDEGGLAVCL